MLHPQRFLTSTLAMLALTTGALSVSAPLAAEGAAPKPTTPPAPVAGGREKPRDVLVELFDLNGDGVLDESEKAAVRAAIAKRREETGAGDRPRPPRKSDGEAPPPGAAGPDGGAPGDGGDRPPGPPAPGGDGDKRAAELKALDTDGDGTLSDDERAAGWAARAKERNPMIYALADSNDDGVLSKEEALRAWRIMERTRPPGPPGAPGARDGKGKEARGGEPQLPPPVLPPEH